MNEYKVKIDLTELKRLSKQDMNEEFGIEKAKITLKVKGENRDKAHENVMKALEAYGFEAPYGKCSIGEPKKIKNDKEQEIDLD